MNHEGTKNAKEGDGACASLDAYLNGELAERDALSFETHLAECSACADAEQKQRWIDGLLRSPAAAELESAPKAAMIVAIKRRQRRRVAVGVAVAAALAAVAAWPHLPLPGREGLGEGRSIVATSSKPQASGTVVNPSPSPARMSSPQASLRGRGIPAATFVSSADAIAVPLESPAVNVTVVQIYPTVDSQRRLQLAAALSSISSEPNGG